jgi:hypothetical protein
VGVPLPGDAAVTLAVKVTDWPNTDGFADEVRVVFVASWFTVCASVAEVLDRKLPSPAYETVMECDPTSRDLVW